MNEKIEKKVENAFNKIINELDLEFGYEGLKEDVSNILEPLKKDIVVLLNENSELKELREFAKIVVEKSVDIDILKSYINCDKLNGKDFDYKKYKTYNYAIFSKQKLTQAEFDLIKKVVEKYGNIQP